MAYFFDTYILVELVKGNRRFQRFEAEEVKTSHLNMGELYYALLRDYNKKTAQHWHRQFADFLLPASLTVILRAMELRFAHRRRGFSFIDCVGYELAKEYGLVFLTGDRAFKGLENAEVVS